MRILSPIGKGGWSPGLVKRDQRGRGADSEGRGRSAFPQSDRSGGGEFFGAPNEGRSRSGPVKRRGRLTPEAGEEVRKGASGIYQGGLF